VETIYVDVLIVLNIYVNFFLLRITAGFTHSSLKTGRCIAAALYGSLFSLIILLPGLDNMTAFLIKTSAAVSIVALAFGVHGKKRLITNTIAFFTSNFVLAGAVYGVYSFFKPHFMHFNNTCFYIDFSLVILILTTALLYAAVRILRIWTDKTPEGSYNVFIRDKGKVITLNGLADTGNGLVDYFSGSPVIICAAEYFTELTGCELDIGRLPRGFRLLPCSAVSGNGLIPVFRPDEIIISCTNGSRKPVDAVIGFGECGGKAVFNPKLLKI
jgi:stage II sporulation protein GA (sporulation sigma-E factor processing peptidase)